jgi:hypothetical protein
MKRPALLSIFLLTLLSAAGCGGGTKKEASPPTTTAAATETTATTAAAETTTTTAAATTTTAAAATGQALKDGFSVVSGTSLYSIEDTKPNTVGNANYTGWKASLDLTGDLDAIADAYIAQINTNGFKLLPEDKGENTSEGRKIRYRSFTGIKEEPSAKAVGGKRTTDQVIINVLKSDSGTGQVTINMEHIRYTG